MSKWKTEDHFVSRLRCPDSPDNKVSGDKIIAKGRLPANNKVTIFTDEQYLPGRPVSPISELSWGLPWQSRLWRPKLARLVYRVLRYGMQFLDRGTELPSPTPQGADQPSDVESCPAEIPNY
jgi:hypothetical protein